MMLRRYGVKYAKSANRTAVFEQAKEDKANDYASLSTEELEGITNNDLKAYLDGQGVEYPSKVNKDELIALVTGK